MSGESWKDKGNEEFKKGNYEKAIEFYTYATEVDPKNHIYLTNRSLCYASMKRWDKSLRDAEKSIALKNTWTKGWYRKAVALREMEQYQKAFECFEKCSELEPNNNEYKKAAAEAKRLMYKDMSEAEIAKVDGNALFKSGKIQDAINMYTKGIEKAKEETEKEKKVKADLFANRAACYVQLYEPQKVRSDCMSALNLVPNHFKALLRRGLAYESLENYKFAVADFEAALKQHPGDNMAIQALNRCRKAVKQLG